MEALRIANCSGFYGDRLSAAAEMVEDGPIDVLTGDYLAELTMAILWRHRMKDPEAGFATTFLEQMEQVLARCAAEEIKVVANAGGLNPAGLARRLAALADRLGVRVRIARVEGDDLLPRLERLTASGHPLRHIDHGTTLAEAGVTPVTANAYLGGWGICAALQRGADVVVTGRVSDASLVVGPAAAHFGWRRHDWDALAGAVVAGHVIECGAQATGGNYSFFQEVPGLHHVGFPLVEMHRDGSCVVTKHPGTGGLVSVGTVTAQLLYEIGGPAYLNPDVTAHFDTITLTEEGPHRVRVTGVRGSPPPATAKVAVNYLGGFRNRVTFLIPGLAVEDKARLVEEALWKAVGGKEQYREVDVTLIRSDRPDPPDNDAALAQLRVTVKDPDAEKVGRGFSRAAVELALAHYPGFLLTGPPTDASPYAVYWPAVLPSQLVPSQVVMDEERWEVAATEGGPAPPPSPAIPPPPLPAEPVTRAPLGLVVGARSGDKGGDANVGVWARNDRAYAWLVRFLDADTFRRLVPEAAGLPVECHPLPNLRAVNVVVRGLLGEGVAASVRTDPQAKTLGEYLRARHVDIPVSLLSGGYAGPVSA